MFKRLIHLVIINFICRVAGEEWLFEVPNAPERWTSQLFGLPTWIIPIEGYHADTFNATTLFSVLAMGVSLPPAIWFTWKHHSQGVRNVYPLFNYCVLGYLVATFFASFSFLLMNAGKVWASFGVFHNLLEIALLFVLLVQRKMIPYFYFVPGCFIYIISTMMVVVALPWPLDALFFKFQGLATDWALFFYLYRLYSCNKQHDQRTKISIPAPEYNDGKVLVMRPPVHFHLGVIAIAAFLHSCGNSLVTFQNDFTMWVIFQFIYAVSFPMYAYYCIVEPDTSRILWSNSSIVMDVALLTTSLVVSGTFIALGIMHSGALN